MTTFAPPTILMLVTEVDSHGKVNKSVSDTRAPYREHADIGNEKARLEDLLRNDRRVLHQHATQHQIVAVYADCTAIFTFHTDPKGLL